MNVHHGNAPDRADVGELLEPDPQRLLSGMAVDVVQVDLLGIEHVILGPGNVAEHGARRGLLVVNP